MNGLTAKLLLCSISSMRIPGQVARELQSIRRGWWAGKGWMRELLAV
jgi:hypothetical protein